MICPKCSNALPDDSKFCQYCGSKLFTEKKEPFSTDTLIAELPNTGKHVQQTLEKREAQTAKRNRITISLAVLLACVAFVVILVCLIIMNRNYNHAVMLMNNERYQHNISDWRDIKIPNTQNITEDSSTDQFDFSAEYAEAENLLAEGKTAEAAIAFGKLGGYKDARERSFGLWDKVAVRQETLSVGTWHFIGLTNDGTVISFGGGTETAVSDWTGISAISAGSAHTVGLKKDGTVKGCGDNDYGQRNVKGWTDVAAISAGGYHTVGLKKDGTVIAVGRNDDGQCNVTAWTDIIAISAGGYHTVGLKRDGTVIAAGNNNRNQCDISEWTDIVAISAGTAHTVGLKSDGTVVAVGNNDDGQCNVSEWTDIVAISAGNDYTVAVKNDGNVANAGISVSGWTDIVAVGAGYLHPIGLKRDGTVVYRDGEVLPNFKNIKLPVPIVGITG